MKQRKFLENHRGVGAEVQHLSEKAEIIKQQQKEYQWPWRKDSNIINV